MKPVVFIHAKKDQLVSVKVAAYALKRNSRHADQFEVRTLFLEDHPYLLRFEGRRHKREGRIVRWTRRDPQAFVLLRFLPPELMSYHGKALVMDTDIFALGDIYELLSRDMQGKSILCRKIVPPLDGPKPNRRPYYNTSVMLMDCSRLRHWNWKRLLKLMFRLKKINYNRLINLGYESEETVGMLEEEWNHLDTLTQNTKLLHNTRRITQPWMTGLPYDRIPHQDEEKLLGFIPGHLWTGLRSLLRGEGYLPFGRYKPHPDPNQEKYFFSLLKEALEKGEIEEELLRSEIRKGRLRTDTFEKIAAVGQR